MAPEQAKGSRDLDHRVDLYAAGVILYEAITGEVPFNADTFNELLFKIVLEAAKPVDARRRVTIRVAWVGCPRCNVVAIVVAPKPSKRARSSRHNRRRLL